jgi:hypothetical protein
MAKTTLLTATLPNGETVTRRTARTYTHVVATHRPERTGTSCAGEEKVFPECWLVVGWAGRPDLAAKLANRCSGLAIPINA